MGEPAIVSVSIEAQLGKLLFWGNYEEVVAMMEANNVQANAVMANRYYTSLIEEVISGCESNNSLGQNNHFPLAKYLLDNGADVTIQNNDGYSALYLAAIDTQKIKYLELMLEYPIPNINQKEKAHGFTALSGFIKDVYSKQAVISVSLKHNCLKIIETFLQKGADPDIENRHGSSANKMLIYHNTEAEAIKKLFEKYKDTEKAVEVKVASVIPETLLYPDVAKKIWKTLVPKNGSSDTVQGELLRAVEKLRDEAQRNGNINFSAMHKNLGKFIKEILIASIHFDKGQKEEIKAYVDVLSKKNYPYIDDDAYDYLTDRVCEFFMKEPTLIPFTANED
jgi:ankyrin repeat protein